MHVFQISEDGSRDDFNTLKINDAKTEFIVFRSPMLKHDLSDLSVNVGGNVIKPSELLLLPSYFVGISQTHFQ